MLFLLSFRKLCNGCYKQKRKSHYPVSVCNPEEGTQLSHPERYPEEHLHHSSQLRETHLVAKGTYEDKHDSLKAKH